MTNLSSPALNEAIVCSPPTWLEAMTTNMSSSNLVVAVTTDMSSLNFFRGYGYQKVAVQLHQKKWIRYYSPIFRSRKQWRQICRSSTSIEAVTTDMSSSKFYRSCDDRYVVLQYPYNLRQLICRRSTWSVAVTTDKSSSNFFRGCDDQKVGVQLHQKQWWWYVVL